MKFNSAHDQVTVSRVRNAQIHLNALKFLESDCNDCLVVYPPQNNGDGTIDLRVKIKHPFYGLQQYTGFDVKGIIIFNGSLEFNWAATSEYLPDPYKVSWRNLGDPEVLNPDGYTYRWNLWWDSGFDAPIFKYYEGKYSKGEPNAHINAYLDFYTHEERHMFSAIGEVERTYKIWLPPSQEVTAGYSVEACWEPPIRTPVTDPLNDFPITANQSEPYHFEFIVNEGEVIKDCSEYEFGDCSKMRVELKQWNGLTIDWVWAWRPLPAVGDNGGETDLCDPEYEDSLMFPERRYFFCTNGDGSYRGVLNGYHWISSYKDRTDWVFDVFDVTIDTE